MHGVGKPVVIGVLGLGAMGAGVAGDLRASGFDVVSTAAGRSGRSAKRGAEAGVRMLADLDAVLRAADTFLSIVPADQAEPLANAVAAALRGKALHYIDANSITPSKTARIARTITAAGATYSDGGIIGPPPGGRMKTRLYVSGPSAGVLQALASERMPVIALGESLTQATEMKVLFSAANKGAAALLANIMAAAEKVGLRDRVMGELDGARPGLLAALRTSAGDLDDKAARWAIEMDDIAEGLEDLDAHGGYHRAAGEGYRRLAANLPEAKGDDALARVLAAWVGPEKALTAGSEMSSSAGVVILGAGHAGGTLAALLRQHGWTGPVMLIGAEPDFPYQRPPLSKAWLKGEATAESLSLKPRSFYAENGIDLRLATRAVAIDRDSRRVTLDNGDSLPYEHLVLALGSRLRKLPVPGADLGNVLELRTVADADRIKAVLRPGARLAVVGGGYIGLEVAASARALGLHVTVIEREARLLARVASPELSHFFAATHRAKGVELLLGASVAALDGDDRGAVRSVRLGDGRSIASDAALIGVGALANDDIARAAGLDCNDGIIVDESTRTSDPGILAIGDCTRRPLAHYARSARLESVPNALEQARVAAASICGRPAPAPEVPWFWSDQYDVKLQMAGLPFDVASIVTRGDPGQSRFAIFHLDATSAVRVVEAINAGAEFMGGRLLIASRKPVDPRRLADMRVAMKELIA